MQLNCVQQAYQISTRISLSTCTRGQHVCFSLLLARGRHCYAGRAIRWALPRISSLLCCSVCSRQNLSVEAQSINIRSCDFFAPYITTSAFGRKSRLYTGNKCVKQIAVATRDEHNKCESSVGAELKRIAHLLPLGGAAVGKLSAYGFSAYCCAPRHTVQLLTEELTLSSNLYTSSWKTSTFVIISTPPPPEGGMRVITTVCLPVCPRA